MTEDMMKEILEDWMSWKYDIIEMNNSEWTQRDESKLPKPCKVQEVY